MKRKLEVVYNIQENLANYRDNDLYLRERAIIQEISRTHVCLAHNMPLEQCREALRTAVSEMKSTVDEIMQYVDGIGE